MYRSMLMWSLIAGYLLITLVIGAAVQHEALEKPYATLALVLLWPIILPICWIVAGYTLWKWGY